MSDGMVLSAAGLASKWGFNDGDVPDELWGLLDVADPDGSSDWDWTDILRRMVRERLLPLLPGVEAYDVETSHNPIRTDHWGDPACYTPRSIPDVSVVVPWSELLAEMMPTA